MTAAIIAFSVLGALCVVAVMLGLPGTWVLVGLALILELADAWITGAPTSTFGVWALGGAVGLGLAGEGVELLSSALGIKGGGGTRRGMVGSMAGGLVGGVAGTVFIPIPLVGTIIGVLLGTFAGAYLGETSGEEAKEGSEALKPAAAATVARILGTVAKTGVAAGVWLLLVVSAVWG